MPSDPLHLVGQELKGRYRVERQLGAGGMGIVYQAVQLGLGGPCALKVVHPRLHAQGEPMRRFRREASLGARVRHEGLVWVFDFDQLDDGTHFYAMELLSGRSLGDVLRRAGALPWPEAVDVAMQAATALHALHQVKVVHRDLKPDNLQLLDDGRLKVLDLGVVHACIALGDGDVTDIRTTTGQLLGTPAYMAPEQLLDSSRVEARTDVYALMLVLFELVTGQQPFSGRSFEEVAQLKFLKQPVPPLRRCCQKAPARLEALVLRALGPVDGRPASMAAVIDALERIQAGDRQAIRGALAARAREVPHTPLPLWGDPVDGRASTAAAAPPLTFELAWTQAQKAAERQSKRSQTLRSGRRLRLAALLSVAGLLGCLALARVLTLGLRHLRGPLSVAEERKEDPRPGPATAPVLPSAPVPAPARAPAAPPPGNQRRGAGQADPGERRPAPAPREAPARTALGRLRVAVRPFAEIYIDGAHRPEGSPHTYALPAGRHQVRAINTTLGQDETRAVKVPPGGTAELIFDWSPP